MVTVDMRSVRKEFGASVALADFSLSIGTGELICLLGPSGCGKTTALRVLAGFEKADAGSILVDGEDITSVPVQRRNFGMVFQDYSLFPTMTARANIEFGLKVRGSTPAQRAEVVERMIEVTALGDHADKYPHQMSGGQKQRVALARAIATTPRVLLLDEPLSALDAKVRESLRDEIRRLQREIGVTTVFVTHDQGEALVIADRVGVMSEGRLEQVATPRELYEHPANAFVATFVGSVNMVAATSQGDGRWQVLGRAVAGAVLAGSPTEDWKPSFSAALRPEQLALDPIAESVGDPHCGTVRSLSFLGPMTRVAVDSKGGISVIADVMSADAVSLRPGERVRIRIRDDVTAVAIMESR